MNYLLISCIICVVLISSISNAFNSKFNYAFNSKFKYPIISISRENLIASNEFPSQRLYLFKTLLNFFEDDKNKYENIEFPMAVIVAGLKDKQLEIVDDVLYNVLNMAPPVIILSQDRDSERTLADILLSNNGKTLKERDHIVPQNPLDLEFPVIIMSGLEKSKVLNIITVLRMQSSETTTSSDGNIVDVLADSNNIIKTSFPDCAFAVAVKPALDKTFKQLLGEIVQDFRTD